MREATPEATIEQLDAALRSGRSLVDVRESIEYVQGHIPGARPIPMGQLAGRLDELDHSGPVFVACASGGRSASMTHFLRNAGFDAYSVAGGTSAWARSGRPLVSGHTGHANAVGRTDTR